MDPPCCRQEWPAEVTTTQTQVSTPQTYDQPDITIKVGGTVNFVFVGFENVQEVGDFVGFTAVSDGIFSGNPANGGMFSHVFNTPGVFYLWSQVHDTLQAKVTVVGCTVCRVISGYNGTDPVSFAVAVSSQTAGSYSLSGLTDHARVGSVTVYAGQTVTATGSSAPTGQLALLDGSLRVLANGTLNLVAVHLSDPVALESGAALATPGSQVDSNVASLALPLVPSGAALPACEVGGSPSVIYQYQADLDMQMMLTCATMGGVAAWRPVLTSGGVLFDGSDLNAWIAAIGSGLPGMYVLRLAGDAVAWAVAVALVVSSFQDVRVVSTATGGSSLTFGSAVTVNADGALTFAGSGELGLGGTLLGCAMSFATNAGTVSFAGSGLSLVGEQADGSAWQGAVSGALPGTVTIQPSDGGERITVSRSGEQDPTFTGLPSSAEASWSSGGVTNANGRTFTLYRMAGYSGFTGDAAGAALYQAICAAAGLHTVGSGSSSYYGNCAAWGCLPTPAGTDSNGAYWGSTYDVDYYIRTRTGWTEDVLIHAYNTGYPYAYPDNAIGSSHTGDVYYPVCISEN